jgi:hypothetical protein
MYKLTGDENIVLRLDDMTFVPRGNQDWQDYQDWLEAGNVPEPQFNEEELHEQQTIASTNQLNALTRQANAQVSALGGRITTLDWLIDGQDPDDEDYEAPTPADVAERTALKARFTKWNSYANKLSKVKAAPGWPANPTWPVMPEPYTNETSALVAPEA